MWFMYSPQQIHIRSILIKEDLTADLREEINGAQQTKGKWSILNDSKVEI